MNAIIATKGVGNIALYSNGSSGNIMANFIGVASAVNYINVTQAVTTASPSIAATGTDTNVILTLQGRGTGGVTVQGTSAGTPANASAGYVGEFVSSVIAQGSAVTQTANAAVNVTSISLTAGDWDVWGNATLVTQGTTTTGFFVWISSTTAALPDFSVRSGINPPLV